MPEFPFEDLELDLSGMIGDAVLRMLRDTGTATGAALATVLANRIFETEFERLAVDKAGTYTGHNLLVALGPVAEDRTGNAGYTELRTAVDMYLLSPVSKANDTQRWLRSRIFHQVKKCLMVEQGTLRDGDGNRLTEALKRFDRLDLNARLTRDSTVIVTAFRATFVSDIDEATRTFLT